MQGKMSLHTLLNPDDIDSGASVSARSTPDPATPASAASQPEAWTPATRWSSLHRRNESLESTASSSRDQVASQEIRFPPFNELDVVSRQLALEFNVEPLGAIRPRQRPVSYNSDKRELKARTGLNKFHVFEYTFQLKGDDKKWCVMWDYRLGLVRFTPFFKCLNYNKTAPARMVQANPGLDKVKHNITGGSIAAQGYWVPYHCARELAAKFCYHIAGALIPIFGPTFPRDCVHPSSPDFDDMTISQTTIEEAHLDAMRCFDRQQQSRVNSKSPAVTSHPYIPDGPLADTSQERPRVGSRWSEPPGTSLGEPSTLRSFSSSHWPSRPGTQDGSSPSGYGEISRPTPTWSHSSYPSPQVDTLPSLRNDLPLPPLRGHLQQMASRGLSEDSRARLPRARDVGTIDPRLLGVEDEDVSRACHDDTSAIDSDNGDESINEGENLAALSNAAEILLHMRYESVGS